MGFVKITVIGGVLFLVPIVIFMAVIGKALEVSSAIAAPLAALLPVDSIGDIAIVHLIAIAIIVAICFIAGLIARTTVAQRLVDRLESSVLSKIPAYALMKTKTQSILNPDDIEDMAVVIIRFDDSWQMAFEIERVEGGGVAVFLPGAPDPWSGSICVVTADRVSPLDTSISIVAKISKRLGRGAGEAVRDRLRQSQTPA